MLATAPLRAAAPRPPRPRRWRPQIQTAATAARSTAPSPPTAPDAGRARASGTHPPPPASQASRSRRLCAPPSQRSTASGHHAPPARRSTWRSRLRARHRSGACLSEVLGRYGALDLYEARDQYEVLGRHPLSPSLRGEGEGEGQQHAREPAAAPHPSPLPIECRNGERAILQRRIPIRKIHVGLARLNAVLAARRARSGRARKIPSAANSTTRMQTPPDNDT